MTCNEKKNESLRRDVNTDNRIKTVNLRIFKQITHVKGRHGRYSFLKDPH